MSAHVSRPTRQLPAPDGNVSFASDPYIDRPFVAFDVKSGMFRKRPEVALLYASVFNDVKEVDTKWTEHTARILLDDRIKRPGVLLALVDTQNNDMVMGAFFARIVPGREGINLREPDILVHPNYRLRGLGNELGYIGRQYANKISLEMYGECLSENISQTYKIPTFPKAMWRQHGYSLHKLFVQNAKEILDRESPDDAPKGRPRPPRTEELNALAEFMCDPATASSDKGVWTKKRAFAFLEYVNISSGGIIKMTENGIGISGLMVGDTVQRRTGSSLISLTGFISRKNKTPDQIQKLAQKLTYDVVSTADALSHDKTRQPVTEVEISKDGYDFFSGIMPSLSEDKTFLNMSGDHKQITDSLRPKEPPQISLVASKTKKYVQS